MFEKIISIISKYTDTPADKINEDTSLLSDLRMESMNFIDMICEFEECFNREIPERDFRKFITVKKISAYFDDGEQTTIYSDLQIVDDDDTCFTESHCIVSHMTKRLAEKVPELVMAVYGMNYPFGYLYNPEEFWAKAEKGDIYPYIAINGEGRVTGMISLIRLEINSNAFELGQLMVIPEYRGTNVAELLISYIAGQELKFGVIYSESVTTHKYSQRSCITGGFCDTALKLNIMPAFGDNSRVSCVVSCIELGESEMWVYLPKIYKEAIEFSLNGLLPRIYRNASDIPPDNPSYYSISDDEILSSQYVIVTFTEIGSDIFDVVQKLDEYGIKNDLKSLAVNIPLSCPHNGSVVNILRSCGFYFGGVMPRWYSYSDSLLMQKLYGNDPDWDNIKLFSDKIIKISEIIKLESKKGICKE